MNWFTRVRNSLPFVPKRSTDDTLWIKCPSCLEMIFAREYRDNLDVCPRCEHHGRLSTDARLDLLLDAGYSILPSPEVKEDPLKFRDTKKYTERLKQARARNSHPDAFTVAHGTIDGLEAVVGVQDFGFMGGSMGMAVGAAFVAGAEHALRIRAPYVVVTASGGARMQEGILSLMQMPKATVMTRRLKAGGIPYIVILTDPTSGGVMAAYAMLGDIHIAEPRATLAFTGRRVIEQTIREKLPDDFQTAEYYQKHGAIDLIVHRKELKAMLATVLEYLAPKQAA
jgi:acetyl-CoA carboxylase carboxyl transferase subunit beta